MSDFQRQADDLFRARAEILALKTRVNIVSSGQQVVGVTPSAVPVIVWINATGSTAVSGQVVVSSPGTDRSFDYTTTDADPRVIGVVDEIALPDGSSGRVKHIGYHSAVQTWDAVVAGHYLKASSHAGYAIDAGLDPVVGAFAIALTARGASGAGQVAAYVFPVLLSIGSAIPNIEDLDTAETDTTKILQPDGAGGVAWEDFPAAIFTPVLNQAGITYGAVDDDSLTFSAKVEPGFHRVLYVAVSTRGGPVTGVTWDGDALTRIGSSGSGTTAELWALDNPAMKVGDVVITATSSAGLVGIAIPVDNATYDATPVSVSSNPSGPSISDDIASSASSLVLDVIGGPDDDSGDFPNTGNPILQRILHFNTNTVGDTRGAVSMRYGLDGNVTMAWGVRSESWNHLVINIEGVSLDTEDVPDHDQNWIFNGPLTRGTVVKLKASGSDELDVPTTLNDPTVIGAMDAFTADNTPGRVILHGYIPVLLVHGVVAVGDYLGSSDFGSGYAASNGVTPVVGCFAIALSAFDGSTDFGTIEAYIFPTLQISSGGVTDHGALTGLGDDDHDQYLKDKTHSGLASEIPLHEHSGDNQAGRLRYRQFVYAVSGGDFSFIIDSDGNPVMNLEDFE